MTLTNRPPEELEPIPIVRLSEYIRAAGEMREQESIPVGDLLAALEDVTRRQLQRDLLRLGFSPSQDLPRAAFARALRGQLKQARTDYQISGLLPARLPDADAFLASLQQYTGERPGQRAAAVEAAFDFAEHNPEWFIKGHGLFRTDPGAESSRPIVAYRHQVEEAQRIVERYHGNVIAVHEVGLGKTITAILAICELLLRNPELTVLILVPTNLKKQWEKEIVRCVDIPFYTGASPEDIAFEPFVLMSIDTAKEARWAKLLTSRDWGLLVVDEGHLLRHDATARYHFIYSLHARRHLLLTATPVHNSPYDIFHQVNIVVPGFLGKKDTFAESHIIGDRQLARPDVLQERLRQVVSHKQRSETGLAFPMRQIEDVSITDRSDLERALYNDVLGILRGIYRRHIGALTYLSRPSGIEQGVSQLVLVAILVLRELASQPRAALKTLSGPLLKQVEHFADVSRDTTDLQTLQKILTRYTAEDWTQGGHAKTDELIRRLPGLVDAHGRVIVYVEFRETQKVIIERLQKKHEVGLPAGTGIISFHGELTLAEKDRQIDRFRQLDQVIFVSTDAGGQGLNLQDGHVVVNFDFPWNPMRVEQRIGRVDRLEQAAAEVLVQNYITVDTIEQYVYQTLRQKLKVGEDVLGHVLPLIFRLRLRQVKYASDADVLGIGQIILSSKDDEDLRQKFLRFGESLENELRSRRGAWSPTRRWIDE